MSQIQKVTLQKVYISDTDKAGNKLYTRAGKPYTKIAIKTDRHGAHYLSGFINSPADPRNDWKEGQVVEIVAEQKGQYLNFRLPDAADEQEQGLELRVKVLEAKVKNLETKAGFITDDIPLIDDEESKLHEDIPF